MSPEFSDLIGRLLDKDPGRRIGWAALPEHPFWQAPLPLRAMPPEPRLAAYLASQRAAAAAAPAPAAAQRAQVLAQRQLASIRGMLVLAQCKGKGSQVRTQREG